MVGMLQVAETSLIEKSVNLFLFQQQETARKHILGCGKQSQLTVATARSINPRRTTNVQRRIVGIALMACKNLNEIATTAEISMPNNLCPVFP
jgi:hypothetical protein